MGQHHLASPRTPTTWPPQTASCLLATRGPRQVRGRRWGSRTIFVLLFQHAAQNILPNLILQTLLCWMEPENSIPLFIFYFLSFPTDLKIDHRGGRRMTQKMGGWGDERP